MKASNYQFFTLGLLLLASLFLSSFSSIPVVEEKVEQPPLEKKKITKQQKRQAHLQKRYQQLNRRFEQAKSSKKRLYLQKRIRKVELQTANPAAGYGLTSLLVGIVGGILALLGLVGIVFSTSPVVLGFLWTALFLGLAGLASAVAALIFRKKNPTKSRVGLAIVGLVFSIITVLTALGLLISISL